MLNRFNLTVLVNQLGGQADAARMASDQYREKVRQRATELAEWILDSGDAARLGLTREDVQTPIKQIKWGKYMMMGDSATFITDYLFIQSEATLFGIFDHKIDIHSVDKSNKNGMYQFYTKLSVQTAPKTRTK